MTDPRATCTKLTQRHEVCGRELLANTKCPGGYLHAEAPRFPSLWPPVSVLAVGGVALLAFLYGWFSFVGPFEDANGATVGADRLVQGSSLRLGAGETQGLYEVGACDGEAADPSIRLVTLVGGGDRLTVYPSTDRPTFGESTAFHPSSGVQQCATFTPTRAATYTVVYLSFAASQLGVVPSSQLWRVTAYRAAPWLLVAVLVGGGGFLAAVLRRRYNATDPFEHEDLTHDTVGRLARQHQSFRSHERGGG